MGDSDRVEVPEQEVRSLQPFGGRATSKRYIGTQSYIEDLLGRPVDRVTDDALRRELRHYVEREETRRSMSERERGPQGWRFHVENLIGLCESGRTRRPLAQNDEPGQDVV